MAQSHSSLSPITKSSSYSYCPQGRATTTLCRLALGIFIQQERIEIEAFSQQSSFLSCRNVVLAHGLLKKPNLFLIQSRQLLWTKEVRAVFIWFHILAEQPKHSLSGHLIVNVSFITIESRPLFNQKRDNSLWSLPKQTSLSSQGNILSVPISTPGPMTAPAPLEPGSWCQTSLDETAWTLPVPQQQDF